MADVQTQAQAEPQAAAREVSEFDALLQKEFRPKTDRARTEVEAAVRTLAEQALATTVVVSDDVVRTIESIIAEVDKKLSQQVNQILHHPDFQQLEGAWRGLYYLVSN